MNRDEAVKKIAKEGYISIEHAEDLYDSIVPKPVVPQYVVDWVDKSRKYDYDFEEWFDCINQSHDVYEWLNCGNKRKAELNALAFATLIVNGRDAVTVEKEPKYLVKVKGIDGYYPYPNPIQYAPVRYEVEEKPRYTVRIRNLNVENCFLAYNNFNEKWVFSERYISNDSFRITHTLKEIEEANFGWVFDCDGVEVKEV